MEKIQNTTTTKKKILIDGDTLVRLVGEAEADEYLYRTGYQAKLTKFIIERDRKIEEGNKLSKKETSKK